MGSSRKPPARPTTSARSRCSCSARSLRSSRYKVVRLPLAAARPPQWLGVTALTAIVLGALTHNYVGNWARRDGTHDRLPDLPVGPRVWGRSHRLQARAHVVHRVGLRPRNHPAITSGSHEGGLSCGIVTHVQSVFHPWPTHGVPAWDFTLHTFHA